jgi:AbrB family looped-hinge helix DNA binding protein
MSHETRPNSALAYLTTNGRITIPKAIRDVLQLRPGDQVVFALEPTQVVLTKAQRVRADDELFSTGEQWNAS